MQHFLLYNRRRASARSPVAERDSVVARTNSQLQAAQLKSILSRNFRRQ